MSRDKLGGFPYEISKEKEYITIRFYPKSPNAKNPNDSVQTLKLNERDRQKLIKMLT